MQKVWGISILGAKFLPPSIIPASTRPWRAFHPTKLWRLELEHVHPIWQGNQWLRNPHKIGEKCWKSPPAMGGFFELVEVKIREKCSWDFFSVCFSIKHQLWSPGFVFTNLENDSKGDSGTKKLAKILSGSSSPKWMEIVQVRKISRFFRIHQLNQG